jgi:hypothetical protein
MPTLRAIEAANAIDAAWQHLRAQAEALPEAAFWAAPAPERWSPAQHIDHLRLSVKPMHLAFWLWPQVLHLLYTAPNRPSFGRDEVIQQYRDQLAQGAKASKSYVPPARPQGSQAELLARFAREHQKLTRSLRHYPDYNLDHIWVPHPILGNLKLRELLFWTEYHIQHHTQAIARDTQVK